MPATGTSTAIIGPGPVISAGWKAFGKEISKHGCHILETLRRVSPLGVIGQARVLVTGSGVAACQVPGGCQHLLDRQ